MSYLYSECEVVPFSTLKGITLSKVEQIKNPRYSYEHDSIIFQCENGLEYVMAHSSECCECVVIEDICGDLDNLVNSPILVAEERTNGDEETKQGKERWTFYEIATLKGSVTIRWYGESNGYYSVNVELFVRNKGENK